MIIVWVCLKIVYTIQMVILVGKVMINSWMEWCSLFSAKAHILMGSIFLRIARIIYLKRYNIMVGMVTFCYLTLRI